MQYLADGPVRVVHLSARKGIPNQGQHNFVCVGNSIPFSVLLQFFGIAVIELVGAQEYQ